MPETWTFICLSLLVAAVRTATPAAEDNVPMRQGAPFKIALFTDLHFGEDAWTDWGPRQDLNSVRVMSAVLDEEEPDFVVYLGDVITANNIATKNASLYWDQAVSPARNRGVPWCTVFGNHDDAPFEWPMEWFSEAGIPDVRCSDTHVSFSGEEECSFRGSTRLELMRSEVEKNMLSWSKDGPEDLWPSVSNYVLKLISSSSSSFEEEEEAVAFMYFFDSGGGSYPEVISSAQVKWFLQKSEEINPQSRVPEIIFWHIPSKAYKKVAPRSIKKRRGCVGSIFLEEVAAQEGEMGMMKAVEERPSVKAIFVGHNHGLDWCCPYKKLWLCFARHTGYGGYGNWSRGARVLEIDPHPFSIKSWIRMEDGDKHSELLFTS